LAPELLEHPYRERIATGHQVPQPYVELGLLDQQGPFCNTNAIKCDQVRSLARKQQDILNTDVFLHDVIVLRLFLDLAQDFLDIVGYNDAISAAQMAGLQDPNTSHAAHFVLRIDRL